MSEYLELLGIFMRSTQGLRRMGSAAIDLAYVACGRFDAFFEMNLSPWDIAAGILLVREAGGKVTDFRGKEDIVFDQEIIASSAAMYDPFTKEVALKLG
jgi:myo-inositol-1(or 4)-monophosphatase